MIQTQLQKKIKPPVIILILFPVWGYRNSDPEHITAILGQVSSVVITFVNIKIFIIVIIDINK